MAEKIPPHDVFPFTRDRDLIVDSGYLAVKRHLVHGLVEVDVTEARQALRAAEASRGESLSFTAFLVASLGRAVAAQPRIQAYRDWRRRLVVFRDVDVVTLIEPEPGAVAIPHIIREAQRKSVAEISAEIRSVRTDPGTSAQRGGLVAAGARVPRWVRLFVLRALKLDPHRFKQFSGTVIITSVGMFGRGKGGWGIPFLPLHTMGLAIGGIARKPEVVDEQIQIRDILHLTLSFDHDVVDGAPAARFARELIERIETAAVLQDEV